MMKQIFRKEVINIEEVGHGVYNFEGYGAYVFDTIIEEDDVAVAMTFEQSARTLAIAGKNFNEDDELVSVVVVRSDLQEMNE